jgi:hypothetical protein
MDGASRAVLSKGLKMFKQIAVAVALAAVVIAAGLSAQSKAFSVQDAPIFFNERWVPVDEAVRSGLFAVETPKPAI